MAEANDLPAIHWRRGGRGGEDAKLGQVAACRPPLVRDAYDAQVFLVVGMEQEVRSMRKIPDQVGQVSRKPSLVEGDVLVVLQGR